MIVLDSLDEALMPRRIMRELLRPLARSGGRHGLRLLVGARRDHVRPLESVATVVDLDDPSYFRLDDLTCYVRATLANAPAPLAQDASDLDNVALAVARRAAPSFLIARLVAHAILDEDALPTDLASFPATVGEAMDLYLARLAERNALPDRTGDEVDSRLRDLLRALAYVQGNGAPATGPVWPAMASSLSSRGVTYTEGDVSWLTEIAGSFLIETAESEADPEMRLFHQALVDFFREPSRDRLAHRSITNGLRALVPPLVHDGGSDWEHAPVYVRRHLATHAAAGDCLQELVDDPGFLLAAEPAELLKSLWESERTNEAAQVYQHFLTLRGEASRAEQASYLELAAAQLDADQLVAQIAAVAPARPWSVRSQTWQQAAQALARHDATVFSVSTANIDDRRIIVSGSWDGTVGVWDFATGRPVRAPLADHTGIIFGVAVGEIDHEPIAVSVGQDGYIRVWDLISGELLEKQSTRHDGWILDVTIAEVDGRQVAISAGQDATIRMWGLSPFVEIGEPLIGHQGAVAALDVETIDGRFILVSGGADTLVRTWDLSRAEEVGDALRGHESPIAALATRTFDIGTVAVSADWRGVVRAWNLGERQPYEPPLITAEAGVPAVGLALVDGHPVGIIGDQRGTVRVFDLAERHDFVSPLVDRAHSVWSIAVDGPNNNLAVVLGDEDGTIRTWRISGRPMTQPPVGPVRHIAVTKPGSTA